MVFEEETLKAPTEKRKKQFNTKQLEEQTRDSLISPTKWKKLANLTR